MKKLQSATDEGECVAELTGEHIPDDDVTVEWPAGISIRDLPHGEYVTDGPGYVITDNGEELCRYVYDTIRQAVDQCLDAFHAELNTASENGCYGMSDVRHNCLQLVTSLDIQCQRAIDLCQAINPADDPCDESEEAFNEEVKE